MSMDGEHVISWMQKGIADLSGRVVGLPAGTGLAPLKVRKS
jgi:hypothetical protein